MAQVRCIKARPYIAQLSRSSLFQRVGVYVRVSTDAEDQLGSFETQERHYRTLVESRNHWELVKMYADIDVTETGIKLSQ